MQILTKKMVVAVLQCSKRRQINAKLYCLQCYMNAAGRVNVSIIMQIHLVIIMYIHSKILIAVSTIIVPWDSVFVRALLTVACS